MCDLTNREVVLVNLESEVGVARNGDETIK